MEECQQDTDSLTFDHAAKYVEVCLDVGETAELQLVVVDLNKPVLLEYSVKRDEELGSPEASPRMSPRKQAALLSASAQQSTASLSTTAPAPTPAPTPEVSSALPASPSGSPASVLVPEVQSASVAVQPGEGQDTVGPRTVTDRLGIVVTTYANNKGFHLLVDNASVTSLLSWCARRPFVASCAVQLVLLTL